jgi:hypothetical protein
LGRYPPPTGLRRSCTRTPVASPGRPSELPTERRPEHLQRERPPAVSATVGGITLGGPAGRRFNVDTGHKRSMCRRRASHRPRPPSQPVPGPRGGQVTQVVSHGRHHHNRLSVVSEPWSSGLNARAGSPQNRHSGPPPARASIHPVALAVAACIPSNLGVPFTLVPHDRFAAEQTLEPMFNR